MRPESMECVCSLGNSGNSRQGRSICFDMSDLQLCAIASIHLLIVSVLEEKQDTISLFAFREAFGDVEAARDGLLSDSKDRGQRHSRGGFFFRRPFVPMHGAARVLFDVGISCSVFTIYELKLILLKRFVVEPPLNPKFDSWRVKETVNRTPLHNYIRVWHDAKFSA
jgi:hypothetical protein